MYVPKALFCVNIKSVLQLVFHGQLQGWTVAQALALYTSLLLLNDMYGYS